MIIIVMGVSGCGKSSVGQALAEALGWTFLEGDEFHPPENLQRMTNGMALTDEDRWPWLDRLINKLNHLSHTGARVVLSCSALKTSYRDLFRNHLDEVAFVFLDLPRESIQQRLEQRESHFFSPRLIDSQFEALERPDPSEALCVDGRLSVNEITDLIISVWDLHLL